MSTAIEHLIGSWDEQQAAYITHREQRFDIMLDAIAQLLATSDDRFGADGTGLTVVDLACGPGSLSQRILDRFGGIRVIGIDYDPVLLTLARTWLGERHGDRFLGVDADLVGDWRGALPAGAVQVAVSSTALHWLEPAELVALYAALGELLSPGGLFMNADHLRYAPDAQPFLTAVAAADDERTQRDAHAQGAQTWEQWWANAVDHPALGAHHAERERRFENRPPTPHAPLELHLNALRTAGFSETGVLWRHVDDVVVLARR